MPPPSTPAPKFVFKRPRQGPATPLRASSPRFVTPRISAPAGGGGGTPTPSQLFVTSSARPRYTDDIESSPPSSPVAESPGFLVGGGDGGGGGSESEDGREEGGDVGGERGVERERKRLRVSVSLGDDDDSEVGQPHLRSSPTRVVRRSLYRDEIESSSSSPPVAASEDLGSDGGEGISVIEDEGADESEGQSQDEIGDGSICFRGPSREGQLSASSPSAGAERNATPEMNNSSEDAIVETEDGTPPGSHDYEGSLDADHEDRPLARQPKFQEPPRFKLPSAAQGAHLEGLPPAFSPQRKGARYVPGGLAAEVQGWLSHIKGSGEVESSLRVRVLEVREGGRMYLIRGTRLDAAGTEGEGGEGGDGLRILLAGEGEMTGLGERSRVTEGCVVEAGGLRWDVELDGLGKWTVACDWRISGDSIPR